LSSAGFHDARRTLRASRQRFAGGAETFRAFRQRFAGGAEKKKPIIQSSAGGAEKKKPTIQSSAGGAEKKNLKKKSPPADTYFGALFFPFRATDRRYKEKLTMSNDYLPGSEAKLVGWLANFATVASTHVQELGLSTEELTRITNNHTNATTLLNEAKTAVNAAKGAVERKTLGLKAIEKDTRAFVKSFQSRKTVSTDLKKELGISPQDAPHTKTPPAIPTGVEVAPDADGINVVTWKRGTNVSVTNFIIEAQYPGETQFSVVGNVTATRFVHTGQTPGVTVYYRVRASRHGMMSQPSIAVVAYKAQNPSALRSAA
jgi:hypothetical protein